MAAEFHGSTEKVASAGCRGEEGREPCREEPAGSCLAGEQCGIAPSKDIEKESCCVIGLSENCHIGKYCVSKKCIKSACFFE